MRVAALAAVKAAQERQRRRRHRRGGGGNDGGHGRWLPWCTLRNMPAQLASHARGLLATVSMGFPRTHTLLGVSRAPRGVRC